MALKGTLNDLSIVELIQFPFTGRKTGRLVINGKGNTSCQLFYKDGKLVHSVLGDMNGPDTIVDLVGWTTGSFEFEADVETEERTITLDLHRLVMQALKTRDERAYEDEQRRQKEEAVRLRLQAKVVNTPKNAEVAEKVQIDKILNAQIQKITAENQSYVYMCILERDNCLIAEARRKEDNADYKSLRSLLWNFNHKYPRNNMNRVLIEDETGTVSMSIVDSDKLLLCVFSKDLSLGIVSVSTNKIVQRLSS